MQNPEVGNKGKTLAYSALLIASLAQVSACDISDEGASCTEDSQCDYKCSRIHECLAEGHEIEIRAQWTINGVAPTPTTPEACGRVANFEFHLESDSVRDESVTYYPVPCELGQVFYDRMPDRLRNLRLTAVDADGNSLGSLFRRIDFTSSDFTIDFAL